MKHRPGDLVMNAGRCEGYGYVWRIVQYFDANPWLQTDCRPMVEAVCVRPLVGKPEPMDSWIGGSVIDLASHFQPYAPGQPVQMGLL